MGQSNKIFNLVFEFGFHRVYYCAESVSRSMILRWVNLPAVSYCWESISPQYHARSHVTFPYPIQRNSPTRFSTCFFLLHNSSLPETLTKSFSTQRSIILRWVNLPAVWYWGESVFPQYHTAGSHYGESTAIPFAPAFKRKVSHK